MQRPTDSDVITLKYGATSSPYSATNPHAGVDYRAPTGSNIYAPHSGKVTIAETLGTCGIAVEIDGGRFKSRLCHNSSVKVAVGNNVSEGQVVALSGATGAAIGAHCHWILWDNGVRVDGSKYLTQGGNMPIKQSNLYSLIRGITRREPTLAEVTNQKYLDNPDLAIETFWNNGGKQAYENQNPPEYYDAGEVDGKRVYRKK